LSLKTLFTHKKSLHIGIRSDNTTAVAYVNEMGGTTSILLDSLSAEIWSWCSERNNKLYSPNFKFLHYHRHNIYYNGIKYQWTDCIYFYMCILQMIYIWTGQTRNPLPYFRNNSYPKPKLESNFSWWKWPIVIKCAVLTYIKETIWA